MPCQRHARERTFGARAAKSLRAGLAKDGVHASVDPEPIPDTRSWRLVVCASGFRKKSLEEREQLTWRVLRRALKPADVERIRMLVTMTPAEREPWRTSKPAARSVAGRSVPGPSVA